DARGGEGLERGCCDKCANSAPILGPAPLSHRLVRPVAERLALGVLAAAEISGPAVLRREFLRREAGAFVAAVAIWLLCAPAAGAPPISLSRPERGGHPR